MKRGKFTVILVVLLFLLTACTPVQGSLTILGESERSMDIGDTLQLECRTEHIDGEITWSASGKCVSVDANGLVTATALGASVVKASAGIYSDSVLIYVNRSSAPCGIGLSADRTVISVGENAVLSANYRYDGGVGEQNGVFSYEIIKGDAATLEGNILHGVSAGSVEVVAGDGTLQSDPLTVTVVGSSTGGIALTAEKQEILVGESTRLFARFTGEDLVEQDTDFSYRIIDGSDYAELDDDILTGCAVGTVKVIAESGGAESNVLSIQVIERGGEIRLWADKYYLAEGESTLLHTSWGEGVTYEAVQNASCITLSGNTVTGRAVGETSLVAKAGEVVSNAITLTVVADGTTPKSITLTSDRTTVSVGETAALSFAVTPTSAARNIAFRVLEGDAEVIGNKVIPQSGEPVSVIGIIGGVASNAVTLNPITLSSDPYMNVSESSFYSDYSPAESAEDAAYRSDHYLMSGDISDQDQAPTTANRPMMGGLYVRNSASIYSEDGDTYFVIDPQGNLASKIYRDGAYVTLEDVAAYLFAFGDIPPNYTEDKSGKPSSSPWGEYLRLNHSSFSGDTSRYPYEPVLPDIRGAGGKLYYYEIDIGTTGTDCDPSYSIRPYNNGRTITRGAARIVYTRYNANMDAFTSVNEKYLFYTYNHYNDFQEYLNYQGGWGEMFGNITGGGSLSSSTDYNPTAYVPIMLRSFFLL